MDAIYVFYLEILTVLKPPNKFYFILFLIYLLRTLVYFDIYTLL